MARLLRKRDAWHSCWRRALRSYTAGLVPGQGTVDGSPCSDWNKHCPRFLALQLQPCDTVISLMGGHSQDPKASPLSAGLPACTHSG